MSGILDTLRELVPPPQLARIATAAVFLVAGYFVARSLRRAVERVAAARLSAQHRMIAGRGIFYLVFGLAAAGARAQTEAACGVRYVSAEHVYLDAGRLAGLRVGTAVRVTRETRDGLTVIHAETVAKFGPFKLYFIEMCPAAMSEII